MKQYKSIFFEDNVDIANFITEILIKNFLNWTKQERPRSPFWREGIQSQDKQLAALSKRYKVELTMVKKLLKVFPPEAIIKVISNGAVGIQMIKQENKQKIIYQIFEEAIKLKDIIIPVESTEIVTDYTKDKKKFKDTLKGIE